MRAYVKILSRRIFDELNQFKSKGKLAIGTFEKLKLYFNNIKAKIKLDIGFVPALE